MPATNVTQFSDYPLLYELGLTQVFEDNLKQHKRDYAIWLKEETVKRYTDTDYAVSGLGEMPEKGIGEVFSTDKILKGRTKETSLTPYGLAVVIEYEAMRWELYGVFGGLAEELARAATRRYIVTAYSLLNNSFSAPNSNYQTAYSEDIIDAAHTRMDGGTWSNRSSTNAALSYLAIQQMFVDQGKLVNERGQYVMVTPKLLLTGLENAWIAEEILASTARPDQDNPGVKNTLSGRLSVHSSPYITSTTAWWTICDKEQVRIKMRNGDRPKLERDGDFRTRNMLLSMYCSFNLSVYDSRGYWGSDGGGV